MNIAPGELVLTAAILKRATATSSNEPATWWDKAKFAVKHPYLAWKAVGTGASGQVSKDLLEFANQNPQFVDAVLKNWSVFQPLLGGMGGNIPAPLRSFVQQNPELSANLVEHAAQWLQTPEAQKFLRENQDLVPKLFDAFTSGGQAGSGSTGSSGPASNIGRSIMDAQSAFSTTTPQIPFDPSIVSQVGQLLGNFGNMFNQFLQGLPIGQWSSQAATMSPQFLPWSVPSAPYPFPSPYLAQQIPQYAWPPINRRPFKKLPIKGKPGESSYIITKDTEWDPASLESLRQSIIPLQGAGV